MPTEDAQMTRMVQREITRRYIDSSKLDIRAMHGVVYIRGEVSHIRGHDISLKHELDIIHRTLRSKPGVREVIIDVSIKE